MCNKCCYLFYCSSYIILFYCTWNASLVIRTNYICSEWGVWKSCPQPTRKSRGVVNSASVVQRRIVMYLIGHRKLLLHLYADALSSANSVSCRIWGKVEVWGQLLPAPTYVEPPLHLQFIFFTSEITTKYDKEQFNTTCLLSFYQRIMPSHDERSSC